MLIIGSLLVFLTLSGELTQAFPRPNGPENESQSDLFAPKKTRTITTGTGLVFERKSLADLLKKNNGEKGSGARSSKLEFRSPIEETTTNKRAAVEDADVGAESSSSSSPAPPATTSTSTPAATPKPVEAEDPPARQARKEPVLITEPKPGEEFVSFHAQEPNKRASVVDSNRLRELRQKFQSRDKPSSLQQLQLSASASNNREDEVVVVTKIDSGKDGQPATTPGSAEQSPAPVYVRKEKSLGNRNAEVRAVLEEQVQPANDFQQSSSDIFVVEALPYVSAESRNLRTYPSYEVSFDGNNPEHYDVFAATGEAESRNVPAYIVPEGEELEADHPLTQLFDQESLPASEAGRDSYEPQASASSVFLAPPGRNLDPAAFEDTPTTEEVIVTTEEVFPAETTQGQEVPDVVEEAAPVEVTTQEPIEMTTLYEAPDDSEVIATHVKTVISVVTSVPEVVVSKVEIKPESTAGLIGAEDVKSSFKLDVDDTEEPRKEKKETDMDVSLEPLSLSGFYLAEEAVDPETIRGLQMHLPPGFLDQEAKATVEKTSNNDTDQPAVTTSSTPSTETTSVSNLITTELSTKQSQDIVVELSTKQSQDIVVDVKDPIVEEEEVSEKPIVERTTVREVITTTGAPQITTPIPEVHIETTTVQEESDIADLESSTSGSGIVVLEDPDKDVQQKPQSPHLETSTIPDEQAHRRAKKILENIEGDLEFSDKKQELPLPRPKVSGNDPEAKFQKSSKDNYIYSNDFEKESLLPGKELLDEKYLRAAESASSSKIVVKEVNGQLYEYEYIYYDYDAADKPADVDFPDSVPNAPKQSEAPKSTRPEQAPTQPPPPPPPPTQEPAQQPNRDQRGRTRGQLQQPAQAPPSVEEPQRQQNRRPEQPPSRQPPQQPEFQVPQQNNQEPAERFENNRFRNNQPRTENVRQPPQEVNVQREEFGSVPARRPQQEGFGAPRQNAESVNPRDEPSIRPGNDQAPPRDGRIFVNVAPQSQNVRDLNSEKPASRPQQVNQGQGPIGFDQPNFSRFPQPPPSQGFPFPTFGPPVGTTPPGFRNPFHFGDPSLRGIQPDVRPSAPIRPVIDAFPDPSFVVPDDRLPPLKRFPPRSGEVEQGPTRSTPNGAPPHLFANQPVNNPLFVLDERFRPIPLSTGAPVQPSTPSTFASSQDAAPSSEPSPVPIRGTRPTPPPPSAPERPRFQEPQEEFAIDETGPEGPTSDSESPLPIVPKFEEAPKDLINPEILKSQGIPLAPTTVSFFSRETFATTPAVTETDTTVLQTTQTLPRTTTPTTTTTTTTTTAAPTTAEITTEGRGRGRARFNPLGRPRQSNSFRQQRLQTTSAAPVATSEESDTGAVRRPFRPRTPATSSRSRPDLNRFGGTRSRFRPSSAEKIQEENTEVKESLNAVQEAASTPKSAEVKEEEKEAPTRGRVRPSFPRPSSSKSPLARTRSNPLFRTRNRPKVEEETAPENSLTNDGEKLNERDPADAPAASQPAPDENNVVAPVEESPLSNRPLRRRPANGPLSTLLSQRQRPLPGSRPGRLFPPRRGQAAEEPAAPAQDDAAPAEGATENPQQSASETPGTPAAPDQEGGNLSGENGATGVTAQSPATPASEEPPAPESPFERPGRLRRPILPGNRGLQQPAPRIPKAKPAPETADEPKENAGEPNGPKDIISRLRSRPRLNIVPNNNRNNQARQGNPLSPEERRNAIFRRGPGRQLPGAAPAPAEEAAPQDGESPASDASQGSNGENGGEESSDSQPAQAPKEIKTSAIVSTVAVSKSEDANPAPPAPDAGGSQDGAGFSSEAPAEAAPPRSSRVSLLSRLQSRKPGSLFSRNNQADQ